MKLKVLKALEQLESMYLKLWQKKKKISKISMIVAKKSHAKKMQTKISITEFKQLLIQRKVHRKPLVTIHRIGKLTRKKLNLLKN